MICLLAFGAGSAWAEDVVYKTALFGSSYNSKGVSSYTGSFSATNNRFTVDVANFNNNNNGWDYVKTGNKTNASVGTITTNAAIDKAVTKVTVTIDAVTASNVNSITLYSGTSASACTTSEGTFSASTGAQTVTVKSPAANKFYKISFDCKKGSSNGLVTVSKVEYYYNNTTDGGGTTPETPTVTAPTFNVAAGTYAEDQQVKITGPTGASIYYTFDSTEDPSKGEGNYFYESGTVIISSSCTLRAAAYLKGNYSNIISATYIINKPQVFASLEELVAADLTSGTNVTVSFENVPIKDIFVTQQGYRNGVFFDIQKAGKDIEIYYQNVPEEWVAGGTLSGTMTCPWKLYSGTWELAPDKDTWAWTNLTYTAPIQKTITALEVCGTPTKTAYLEGETFETAGLVITATYSDGTTAPITNGFDWEIDYGKDNTALVAGATSVEVMAYTGDDVMSEVYTVNGLTVTVPVTLTSIAVSGTPTKTAYYVGDAFETAGLVVTGTYSDSHQEVITEGIDWTVDPETLALGTTSVDVKANVGDVVSEVYTVEGLSVTKPDFETITYEFSSFTSGATVELTDLEGFVITLKSNGGTNPAWSSNQARVYAKGSLTVKANNAVIKSIEYDYTVNANKNGVSPTIDGVEGKTDSGSWGEDSKTWTGADEEVTFSTTGTAGNIGFTKLIIKYVESTKIETSLAWSTTEAEVTIGGDDNVFPTLTTTPVGLAGVTYESSNPAVATISTDGVVTLVKEGETTITASFAGNAEYAAANSVSYTLTVVKAPFVPTPAAEGYETVDFAALYSSVTNNATVEDYEGTSFAMAFAKPQSSSTPTKYYDNGKAVRAYEGNTITINAAEPILYVGIDWTVEDDEVSITGLGTTTAAVTFSKTCRFTKVTVSYQGANSTLAATDGENYYATFSSEKNVVFANATAYTVSVADDKLTLTEVARNKVPAGKAVLIKATTANVDYYYVGGDEDFANNMLIPCPETTIFKAEADGNYYYKLAYGDNTNKTKLGFWWGAEDGSGNFNVKAGGAVLCVPQSIGSNLRGFSFESDGITTAIESIESKNVAGEIYNLQGQRINRLQKGVNIVGGKKVLR